MKALKNYSDSQILQPILLYGSEGVIALNESASLLLFSIIEILCDRKLPLIGLVILSLPALPPFDRPTRALLSQKGISVIAETVLAWAFSAIQLYSSLIMLEIGIGLMSFFVHLVAMYTRLRLRIFLVVQYTGRVYDRINRVKYGMLDRIEYWSIRIINILKRPVSLVRER